MTPEMSQISKELNNAYNLYKREKYSEALMEYQKLYENYPEEFGNSDKRFYAKSLHEAKIKTSKKVLDIEDAGEKILELIEQEDCSENDSLRCVYTNAIIDVITFFYRKKTYTKVLYWCEQLNPDYLSKESFIGLNGDINPSRKEKWYLSKSKALLETKQYGEAIELINEAFEELGKFQHENEMWLRYRRAQANNNLGNFQEAIEDLKIALQERKIWYIQQELAYAYYETENHEKAFKYAIDVALNGDEIWKKMNMYKIIAGVFEENNLHMHAKKHYYLLYTIALSRKNKVEEYRIKIENQGFDLTSTDFEKIEKDLREVWIEYKFANEEPMTGRIATLPTNDEYGFIVTDEYDYYQFFKKDFKDLKRLIELNLPVTFYVNNDLEKNTKFDVALNVRVKK